MAPQIAHKHHRGHGKLALGLWGSCYQDIPFVYHSQGLGRQKGAHLEGVCPAALEGRERRATDAAG